MAFWKKSEDPWDLTPEKRRTEMPREETEEKDSLRETVQSLAKELKECFAAPPEEEPEPQACPWCGRVMQRGYLISGQWIYWQTQKPRALSLRGHAADALVINTEGGLSASYKTAWHCPDCRKLVLDVTPPPRPQWEEPAPEEASGEETQEQAQ